MMQNVRKAERIMRIVLGIVIAVLTCLMSGVAGWIRIVTGIIAAAFIVTSLAGY